MNSVRCSAFHLKAKLEIAFTPQFLACNTYNHYMCMETRAINTNTQTDTHHGSLLLGSTQRLYIEYSSMLQNLQMCLQPALCTFRAVKALHCYKPELKCQNDLHSSSRDMLTDILLHTNTMLSTTSDILHSSSASRCFD